MIIIVLMIMIGRMWQVWWPVSCFSSFKYTLYAFEFFQLFRVGVGHFPKSLKNFKHKNFYFNYEKHPILYYHRAI